MAETEQLSDLVSTVVERRQDDREVSPISIANECMRMLDPRRDSVPLVYVGCHMHVRQLARAILARTYDANDRRERNRSAKAGGDLFPGTLQSRYPKAHTADLDDPVYVRRDEMTKADVKYNVDRLRAEGRAKLRHADALEAWWENLHPASEDELVE